MLIYILGPQFSDDIIYMQGRMKSKKAATLFAPLLSPEKFTKPLSDSKRLVCISELNEGANPGTVLVGGVSAIVPTASRVP